jgi:geranylgeranyl reductase family protein
VNVAVVGAGPAGSWAAHLLARQGVRVTVFDHSHPREKPCGGGVTARALALVGNALRLDDCRWAFVRSASFSDSRRGRSATVVLPSETNHEPPGGLTVPLARTALAVASRASFDSALLDAAQRAGAVLERSRVTDISIDRSGIHLQTTEGTHRADFLIGADGANSLVRRRLARPFARDQLSIATGFFAHGCTSDEIVIELLAKPAGYIWSFPRPDHLAIGICAQADAGMSSGTLRATTARWIETTGVGRGACLEPYAWPIPSLSARAFEQLDLAGPRWCLVGDAAGLVDPITREGIYFALCSGQWAAEALLSGGAVNGYVKRVRDEALPELTYAARLKERFFDRAFIDLVVDALQRSEAIRAVMADLVAGCQPYQSLKWRLLKTGELALAWRLLNDKLRHHWLPRPSA